MKQLHVISSLNPSFGGPQETLKQFAEKLNQTGHSLEVAVLDDPAEPWLSNFPGKVYALGQGSAGKYHYNPRLYDWLRTHAQNYDAIVVRGIWQYHGVAAWRALRHGNVPYFVFTHGMLDPWFKRTYRLKHIKKLCYWWLFEYRILRDARGVLFTCEEERQLARESFWPYQCREIVVNYGTAPPPENKEAQLAAFYAHYPELREKRLLVFLSRVHPKKGCDLLIRAYASFVQRDMRLHLLMVGPDQVGWHQELADLARTLGISERITWTGMLSGAGKWGALRAAEAFILPSHQENFGIVVAEALAVGKPVLISDKVNIWCEIAESRSGWVAPDTLAGTESLIQQWLDARPEDLEAMGQNARECFMKRFHIDMVTKNLIEVLSS